jgi:hypothetical protein
MTTPRPDQRYTPPLKGAGVPAGGTSGVLRARIVIVSGTGGGVFIYDTSNNLIGSWVGAATTDPVHGQSVAAGFTDQNNTGTLQTRISQASLTISKLSGPLSAPVLTVVDDTASAASTTIIKASGITAPLVTAVIDSSGTVETWHNYSFSNSWAQAASRPACSYRLNALGNIEIVGSLTVPAGFAANQVALTAIGAGTPYAVANIQPIPARDETNGNTVWFTYNTVGAVTFIGPAASTAAGHILSFGVQQITPTQ